MLRHPIKIVSMLVISCCVLTHRAQAQELVQPTGEVEKVKSGFQFTEGPAAADDGSLYFTDIPENSIHQLSADGEIKLFTNQSGHSNGLLVTSDGRLIACQMDGQVVEFNRETGLVARTLASEYQSKRFNAPNDLVIDSAGGIYFTDPLYRAPDPLPQGLQAVYYINPDGEVARVTEGIKAPNGIGLSPDQKRLYVIPSMQAKMLVYEVKELGQLGSVETFCHLRQPSGESETGGDGMAVDRQGNVYITTHLGIQIFASNGVAVGLIEVPEQPANVTFGGKDRKTLYITARTSLYRVAMPIAGL